MSWYDSRWRYRRKITISGSMISGNLTDFPLIVWTTVSGSMFDHIRTDAYDVIFVDSDDTTKLCHDVTIFDPNNFKFKATVKIPSLVASTNKDIYMYYGYYDCYTNQEDKSYNVWPNYLAVFHFDTNTVYSSVKRALSPVVFSGTVYNATLSSGIIGNAYWFDGINSYIQITPVDIFGSSTTISISMVFYWASSSSHALWGEYYAPSSYTKNYVVCTTVSGGSIAFDQYTPSGGLFYGLVSFPYYTWHHVVYQRNGNYQKWFVDGNLVHYNGSAETYGGSNPTSAAFGSRNKSTGWGDFFRGAICEVRMAPTNFSDSWVLCEYRNLMLHDNYIIWGSEEDFYDTGEQYNLNWTNPIVVSSSGTEPSLVVSTWDEKHLIWTVR